MATFNHASKKLFVFVMLSIAVFAIFLKLTYKTQVKSSQAQVPDASKNNLQSAPLLTTEFLKNLDKYRKDRDTSQLDITVQKAQERKDRLKALVKEDPRAVLQAALYIKDRQFLPPEVEKFIEKETVQDGTLDTLHADDFDHKTAKYFYFLTNSKGEKFNLYLTEKITYLKKGTRVTIKGVQLDNEIAVDNASPDNMKVVSSPSVQGASTQVVKKIAYVLVNFQNFSTNPYTPEEARQTAFTGPQSVNAYYNENSYGAWSMKGNSRADGDIYGWYTIPYNNTNCNSMFSTWTNAANQRVQAEGGDLSVYDNVVYAFNNASGCPGAGWTYIGGGQAWIAFGFSQRIISHELGHDYGLNHASSKICYDNNNQQVPVSTNCTSYEYGDPYDVMGTSGNQFNNFHKGSLGFFEATNTQTVTSSGTFSLAPLGPNTTSIQSLRIPLDQTSPGGSFYYLEFRQPYGVFDNFAPGSPVVNGVSIREAQGYGSSTFSYLYDMTPSTDINDSSLAAGQTFDDPAKGIRIKTESVSPTAASVSINIYPPQCIRVKPKVTIYPIAASAPAGTSRVYQITINNLDTQSCPSTTFSVNTTIPNGWTHTLSNPNYSIAPGTGYSVTDEVASPTTATPGDYSFTEQVVHGADSAISNTATGYYSVLSSAVSPTPTVIPSSTPIPTPLPTSIPSPTPTPTDTTAPSVSITNPQNGAIVPRKSNVTISANASDASGISKVEMYVNNTLICTDATAPYSCSWTVPNQSSVKYTISAKAYDVYNNNSISSITVTSSSCILICF